MSWICDCKTCDCAEPCIHPTGYIYVDSHTRCRRCGVAGRISGRVRDIEPIRAVEHPTIAKLPVDKIKTTSVKSFYNRGVASEPSYYEVRKALEEA